MCTGLQSLHCTVFQIDFPTSVLLPGKSHGQRRLVGCSPWGPEESGTTEWLHFHFSLSCIGEGNGNPLPCSCLENPRDGGAWQAVVQGVAQSQTWLKWLSSSNGSSRYSEDPRWQVKVTVPFFGWLEFTYVIASYLTHHPLGSIQKCWDQLCVGS